MNINVGQPEWCHHWGAKVKIKQLDLPHSVILGSQATELVIRKSIKSGKEWEVIWRVNFAEGYSHGMVYMTTEELRSAFGLGGSVSAWERNQMVAEYKASAACQGKFIRTGTYLNIPGPGTGNDGDPNISVHLDLKIQDAISNLCSVSR